jgi:hypothetical protein
MNRGFRTSTFALALVLGASTGCGSSKSPEAQASDLLAQAGSAEDAANVGDALALSRESMAISPSVDAGLLQAAMQYSLGDVDGANATLALCASVDPSRGEDDLYAAFIASDQAGRCDAIHANLDAARRASHAGLGCTAFWEMIEDTDDPWFAYFRDSCGGEYASLLASKSACPTPGDLAATCNRLAWDKTTFEYQLSLNHVAVTIVDNTAQAMDMMGSLIPNVYVKLVLKVIRLEALRIKVRDHGCGAVLHWLKGQIQIRPEAFRVTSQGG